MLRFEEYLLEKQFQEKETAFSFYETIPKTELKYWFCSFRDIIKLGVNPSTIYRTPVGIYAYQLEDYKNDIDRAKTFYDTFPYVSDASYVYLFRCYSKNRVDFYPKQCYYHDKILDKSGLDSLMGRLSSEIPTKFVPIDKKKVKAAKDSIEDIMHLVDLMVWNDGEKLQFNTASPKEISNEGRDKLVHTIDTTISLIQDLINDCKTRGVTFNTASMESAISFLTKKKGELLRVNMPKTRVFNLDQKKDRDEWNAIISTDKSRQEYLNIFLTFGLYQYRNQLPTDAKAASKFNINTMADVLSVSDGDDDIDPESYQHIKKTNKIAYTLWAYTRHVAGFSNKPEIKWNSLLRKNLDIDIVVDHNLGLIHPNEPQQTLILSTAAIDTDSIKMFINTKPGRPLDPNNLRVQPPRF